MLYFKTLPKVFTPDESGNILVLTNILARAKLLDELQNNPMLFYKYSIQEGDTPEIIADKYYDDSYKYWIIMYSNQLMDPMWDWPMDYNQFVDYLNSKYGQVAEDAGKTVFEYLQSTVYQYQKITTTTDLITDISNTEVASISESVFITLQETTTTYSLPNGTSCKVQIQKNIQYLYDYENELNESKREIKIMDSAYALEMEDQLYSLMRA
jgi:hypothetical protein